jgi:N-acetyl-gamma-glutamyl-phosphate reductase
MTAVAVLGASGLVGGELVRLVREHPGLELAFAAGERSAGMRLSDLHPHLGADAGAPTLEVADPGDVAERAELAFLALPSGASAPVAPTLLDAGVRVVDLSGDHRLPVEGYPRWYGFEHPEPAWLDKAVYGLPELHADAIAGADLVANPGCFPTGAVLALTPPVRDGLIEPAHVVVDGKTGWSGAGRLATEEASITQAAESVRPYGSPGHRHTPEIEHALERATGRAPRVTFVPHLVPASRGVLVTCYATLTAATTEPGDLVETLAAAYAGAPFVRVLSPGDHPNTKRTRGSNVVELGAFVDERSATAVLVAALDNLVKGAAGQAIQNANLMLGLDESAGLRVSGWGP